MEITEEKQKAYLTQYEKDNKAELTLIAVLHSKGRHEKREFCQKINLPWAEYQRILVKWSRVIERFESNQKSKLEIIN